MSPRVCGASLFVSLCIITIAWAGASESQPTMQNKISVEAVMTVAEIQALADAGKYTSAEKSARSAIEKNGQNHELYNLLGFSLRKQNKWIESIAAYETALRLKPDFAQAKEYLAVALLNQGNIEKARNLYMDLRSTHPTLAAMVKNEATKLKVKW